MDYNNEQIGTMRLSFPKSLLFNTYSVEEVKQLSVVKISTPLSFNAMGHPLPGGLYDPAMGPLTQYAVCSTCGLLQVKCGGHLGHIELPLPVINPLYHKSIGVILKMSCLECHRILIPHTAKCLLIGQLSLLHHGYIVEAQEMETRFVDLVKAASWDHVGTQEDDFNAAQKINDYVNSVYSANEVAIKEWRGEVDLRNAYIKEALLKIFKGKLCPFCHSFIKKISFIQQNILIPLKTEPSDKGRSKIKQMELSSSNYAFLMPSDCKDHLKQLFLADGEFMKALLPVLVSSKTEDPIDSLFMEVVLVPPINARPIGVVLGVMSEHPQNVIFKSILNDCVVLRSVMHLITISNTSDESQNVSNLSQERIELVEKLRGKTNADKLQYAWQDLQKSVDCLIDTELHRNKVSNSLGLKQIMEKKQGIIRMNMMGKRVNFAARTVITPDPNLNIDEIGVPEAFAIKLTYPVPVSYYNVNELRKLVINGPFLHPGANFVENEDGTIIKLEGGDLTQREGLAKRLLTPSEKQGIKIVHRHLMNGDILLLNRQPTLHKPSIMAHKARVLKGEKTFRLHYANCKSYNADFDGDEMNAHFPQNDVARSEGYNLVSVGKQYLVPKDGTPLSGLIQDHIVSGVRLSMRGRFFTKDEYMQLSFQGLSNVTGGITFLPPCMIKPKQLWSGKQIISTVIINIISKGGSPLNLNSQAKISASAWSSGDKLEQTVGSPFSEDEMSEAEVIIRGGELLCGVLDKMHYGATPFSLIHCVHELYGGEVACSLLSSFSKLFTSFLQTEGFTLGVEDILVVKKADAKRRKIIDSMRQIGDTLAAKALEVESSNNLRNDLADAHKNDPSFRAQLDHQYKMSLDKFTNEINQVCLPSGLLKPFPINDLQLMVQSGAKGSTVNTMQISCLLGQIELEGKRPPLMISGRSLPSFPPYDTTPRAGGFIDGRFMTGIQPQEFFFHCMAGREGLIDTAVKTSRSGYLQRCLVKHLEGLSVNYDLTVRDSDGSVIQFLYGEDGMEVTKCQFFTKEQMPFLANNVKALLNSEVTDSLKTGSNSKGVRRHKKSIKKWKKSFGASFYRPPNPFSLFSRQASLEADSDNLVKKTNRVNKYNKLFETWYQMDESEREKFQKLCPPPPDPLVSKYQPDRHFGSITEKLDGILESYMKTHRSSVDVRILEDVVHLKALAALANPGEPVGLLAAQSIGEPSTQMTLNTFHFAGRGEMNVTLGIPRLREVLMVASKNIKTPSMEIPFLPDIPKLEKKADLLRRKFCKVTLADVLQSVEVTEELQLKPLRRQLYTLKFNFLPKKAYEEITTISAKQILRHFEFRFLKELFSNLKNKSGKNKNLIEDKAEGKDDDENADNPDDPDEIDERSTKKRSKGVVGTGNEHQSSDEEDGNDDDDATADRRRARQNEEHQYSDLEDEDEDVREEIEGAGKSGKNKIDMEENEETEELPSALVDVKEAGNRISRVTSMDNVVSYSFDTKHQQWCELTLGFPPFHGRIDFSAKLKDLASASTITRVPGIRKAFLITSNGGERLLKTDGKNFGEMYNYCHILDVNRLYTNDIHAVAETYGIEAASKVIVREVQDVFKVYGITVDPRHLTLVADYMTYDGTYRPMSRIGMEGGASPLQQMSFEASTGFLKSSVLRSKRDELMSPSSRLMLGRPVTCGTSAFNLLYSLTTGNVHSSTIK